MAKEPKLSLIPLGGLGEIGKNMLAVRFGENILVIDCGLMFPEEGMLGIDVVIPTLPTCWKTGNMYMVSSSPMDMRTIGALPIRAAPA